MKRSRGNIEQNLNESHLADIQLFSLSEYEEDFAATLYNRVKGGRTESLGNSGHYRLFFLLKGRVHLYSGGYDKYLLYRKEFILLPAGASITCRIEEDSRYVVLNCTGLMSKGNVIYFERLRKHADGGVISCLTLPIRDRLNEVLSSFAAYPVERNQHQTIYDAMFILLRLLYTEEELLLMLHPMLQDS